MTIGTIQAFQAFSASFVSAASLAIAKAAIIASGAMWMPVVVKQTLVVWVRNHRTRAALAKLSIEQLEDVGLTEAQRRSECARPFFHGRGG